MVGPLSRLSKLRMSELNALVWVASATERRFALVQMKQKASGFVASFPKANKAGLIMITLWFADEPR